MHKNQYKAILFSFGIYVLTAIILFITKCWNFAIIWVALPFIVEYICRCYKAKKLIYPHIIKKKVIIASEREQPIKPTSNLITSISVLTVKDFIQCVAYNNLSVLGDGTEEELQNAYIDILSQYYKAKFDEHIIAYLKLMKEIKAIELHAKLVDTITDIMRERYSIEGAKALNKLYPQYSFSQDTFLEDLSMVGKSEIRTGIKYERLIARLKDLDTSNKKNEGRTPEQKQEDLIDTLMEIRKHETVNYSVNEMTVLEFARGQKRLMDHIENLKSQSQRNGR